MRMGSYVHRTVYDLEDLVRYLFLCVIPTVTKSHQLLLRRRYFRVFTAATLSLLADTKEYFI
jgi:hypothetical protein